MPPLGQGARDTVEVDISDPFIVPALRSLGYMSDDQAKLAEAIAAGEGGVPGPAGGPSGGSGIAEAARAITRARPPEGVQGGGSEKQKASSLEQPLAMLDDVLTSLRESIGVVWSDWIAAMSHTDSGLQRRFSAQMLELQTLPVTTPLTLDSEDAVRVRRMLPYAYRRARRLQAELGTFAQKEAVVESIMRNKDHQLVIALKREAGQVHALRKKVQALERKLEHHEKVAQETEADKGDLSSRIYSNERLLEIQREQSKLFQSWRGKGSGGGRDNAEVERKLARATIEEGKHRIVIERLNGKIRELTELLGMNAEQRAKVMESATCSSDEAAQKERDKFLAVRDALNDKVGSMRLALGHLRTLLDGTRAAALKHKKEGMNKAREAQVCIETELKVLVLRLASGNIEDMPDPNEHTDHTSQSEWRRLEAGVSRDTPPSAVAIELCRTDLALRPLARLCRVAARLRPCKGPPRTELGMIGLARCMQADLGEAAAVLRHKISEVINHKRAGRMIDSWELDSVARLSQPKWDVSELRTLVLQSAVAAPHRVRDMITKAFDDFEYGVISNGLTLPPPDMPVMPPRPSDQLQQIQDAPEEEDADSKSPQAAAKKQLAKLEVALKKLNKLKMFQEHRETQTDPVAVSEVGAAPAAAAQPSSVSPEVHKASPASDRSPRAVPAADLPACLPAPAARSSKAPSVRRAASAAAREAIARRHAALAAAAAVSCGGALAAGAAAASLDAAAARAAAAEAAAAEAPSRESTPAPAADPPPPPAPDPAPGPPPEAGGAPAAEEEDEEEAEEEESEEEADSGDATLNARRRWKVLRNILRFTGSKGFQESAAGGDGLAGFANQVMLVFAAAEPALDALHEIDRDNFEVLRNGVSRMVAMWERKRRLRGRRVSLRGRKGSLSGITRTTAGYRKIDHKLVEQIEEKAASKWERRKQEIIEGRSSRWAAAKVAFSAVTEQPEHPSGGWGALLRSAVQGPGAGVTSPTFTSGHAQRGLLLSTVSRFAGRTASRVKGLGNAPPALHTSNLEHGHLVTSPAGGLGHLPCAATPSASRAVHGQATPKGYVSFVSAVEARPAETSVPSPPGASFAFPIDGGGRGAERHSPTGSPAGNQAHEWRDADFRLDSMAADSSGTSARSGASAPAQGRPTGSSAGAEQDTPPAPSDLEEVLEAAAAAAAGPEALAAPRAETASGSGAPPDPDPDPDPVPDPLPPPPPPTAPPPPPCPDPDPSCHADPRRSAASLAEPPPPQHRRPLATPDPPTPPGESVPAPSAPSDGAPPAEHRRPPAAGGQPGQPHPGQRRGWFRRLSAGQQTAHRPQEPAAAQGAAASGHAPARGRGGWFRPAAELAGCPRGPSGELPARPSGGGAGGAAAALQQVQHRRKRSSPKPPPLVAEPAVVPVPLPPAELTSPMQQLKYLWGQRQAVAPAAGVAAQQGAAAVSPAAESPLASLQAAQQPPAAVSPAAESPLSPQVFARPAAQAAAAVSPATDVPLAPLGGRLPALSHPQPQQGPAPRGPAAAQHAAKEQGRLPPLPAGRGGPLGSVGAAVTNSKLVPAPAKQPRQRPDVVAAAPHR